MIDAMFRAMEAGVFVSITPSMDGENIAIRGRVGHPSDNKVMIVFVKPGDNKGISQAFDAIVEGLTCGKN